MSSLQVLDETQAWGLDKKIGKLNRSFPSCSSYGTSTHCSRAAIATECLFFPFFPSFPHFFPFFLRQGLYLYILGWPQTLNPFLSWPPHCCDYRRKDLLL